MRMMFAYFILLIALAFGLVLVGSIFLTQRVIKFSLAHEAGKKNISYHQIPARTTV